ncbi:Regulator of ribonuclease activity B [Pseudoxanthomonas sp. GM95]|uniref:ribonuclease E inhibitor RraB n=1 Tax=Pseudoxanthomonas sp. GM95 TaxID=1881043 RepID=UPI0008B19E9E|nr:ribonuclease E inhibitor RraB [Pseudoxanthomonas sp. GM95]SEM22329.1 Regulator of ribonuclease activity B [Pseudoxanthomonas sp. GM95]
MQRNPTLFPDDDNGDVLWRLASAGDDLSIPREIDFTLDFDTEQSALDCGMFLFRNELKVQLEAPDDEDEDAAWTVLVVANMLPRHAEITHFEQYLQDVAEHYAGHCTGWGCAQQAGLPVGN